LALTASVRDAVDSVLPPAGRIGRHVATLWFTDAALIASIVHEIRPDCGLRREIQDLGIQLRPMRNDMSEELRAAIVQDDPAAAS